MTRECLAVLWKTMMTGDGTAFCKLAILRMVMAEPHSLVNLPIPENLVITWPYTDCPPTRRPSAPQENQCLLSHFLTTLGAQEETDCKSMLWSIDGGQHKVSADQYHLAVSRAQVSTHRDRVLFWRYPLTTYWFSNNRRLNFIFLKFIWKMLCLLAYVIMAPHY